MRAKVFLSHTKKLTYDHSLKELLKMGWELSSDDKILLSTGFTDAGGKEIFDGHILSDNVRTDQGIIKSAQVVFFNEKTGQWCLDNSFNHDCSISEPLHQALSDFAYYAIGNIYQHSEITKQFLMVQGILPHIL